MTLQFYQQKVTFGDAIGADGGIVTQHTSYQFPTAVKSGQVVLQSWNLTFSGPDRYFDTGRAEICNIVISQNIIECDVILQLKDDSGHYIDRNRAYASIVYIADIE